MVVDNGSSKLPRQVVRELECCYVLLTSQAERKSTPLIPNVSTANSLGIFIFLLGTPLMVPCTKTKMKKDAIIQAPREINMLNALCVLDKYGRSQRSDDQCKTSHYYYVKSRVAIIHVGNT